MPTGTMTPYGKGVQAIVTGGVDLDTDSFKFALAATAYTPNNDTHDFWNDVSGNAVSGTNWPAAGVAVTVTVDQDTVNNRVRVFVSDINVATVTLTDGKHGILYKDTGNAATSTLIGYVTFDTALAPTSGTLSIDFDGVNGALRFSY